MGKGVFSKEAVNNRIKLMKDDLKEALANADNLHVKFGSGNRKTNCSCVSVLPILDCKNCKECMNMCYDIKSCMYLPAVRKVRANNSAIKRTNRERFWNEVDLGIKAKFITELRINEGGDLDDEDFAYVAELGQKNPKTKILFFTKNYNGINKFLNIGSFPENVHPIMSCWKGMEMDNPNNLPESHLLFKDGTTTAPDYGAYYCNGNCMECAFNEEGCWTLKKGEHVIFKEH